MLKKKQKQQQQQQLLSDDVISEILSWLPVSSINRFKSVSKSWFILITSWIQNPSFVESHLNHSKQIQHDPTLLFYDQWSTETLCPMQLNSTADNNVSKGVVHVPIIDDCVSIVGIQHFSPCNCNLCSINRGDNDIINDADDTLELDPAPNEFDDDHDQPAVSLYIRGTCNGLMLISIYDGGDLCLWNPCTYEIKEIPRAPFEWAYWSSIICQEVDGLKRWDHELFYDDILGDYKIIMYVFIYPHETTSLYLNSEVLVYTLGTNSWRHIPDPYKLPCIHATIPPQKPLFLNGAHHWVTYKDLGEHPLSLSILAFDTVGEEYREVPVPQISFRISDPELHTIRGDLCMCFGNRGYHYDGNSRHLNVWAMKDYGVKDSWTKLFSVHMQTELLHEAHLLKLLWSFDNGNILILKNWTDIFLFDPKTKDKARLLISAPPCSGIGNGWRYAGSFVGSFVSLNSGSYLHMIKYSLIASKPH